MENQYGFMDLRNVMEEQYTTNVPTTQQQHHHELNMMSNAYGNAQDFELHTTCGGPSPPPILLPPPLPSTMDSNMFFGSGYSQGRWPRQETLTLLEIRSRLDHKFKESAQKAPLWDEISRIMAEEYGYQRSGKKCREKLENLYKYYKKTKDGRAAKQDGKHYRFFRQLEALYGEASTSSNKVKGRCSSKERDDIDSCRFGYLQYTTDCNVTTTTASTASPNVHRTKHGDGSNIVPNLKVSCFSGLMIDDSSSGSDDESDGVKIERSSRRWSLEIKQFVDLQVRKLMEVQEAWLEKMLRCLEEKEMERRRREEEWRTREAAKHEEQQKQWCEERAWMEARDVALIEALQRVSNSQRRGEEDEDYYDKDDDEDDNYS